MRLQQYGQLLWRWAWLIALSGILTGGSAYYTSRATPPVYLATATLLINQSPGSMASADYSSLLSSERLASTYVELLRTPRVLDQVIARLGLPLSSGALSEKVQAQVVRDTQLIDVSVEDTDPQQAAAIVNALAQVFQEMNEAQQIGRYVILRENTNTQIQQVERDIAAVQGEIAAFPATRTQAEEARLGQLQATLAQYRSTYTSLLNSVTQVRLAEAQTTNNVTVAQEAQVPTSPIRPRTSTNTILGLMVGVLFASGVILLVDYLDDTLKVPEDLEQLAHLPTLGLIVRLKAREPAQRLVTALAPRSPVSEAYRALRTNLQFGNLGKPLRRLLVTSGNVTEGKSMTVANLAIVLAQAGKQVIAVDTDLRRPTLHRYFGLLNHRGVTTALLDGQTRVDEHLQTTAIENLRFMASGPLPPNPAELLGSQLMSEVLEKLAAQADVLILDSPPVLSVTDAAILSRQVDGTLLVIDAGTTRREAVVRSLETLRSVGAHLLGTVLNRAAPPRTGYYGYYDPDPGVRQREGQGDTRPRKL